MTRIAAIEPLPEQLPDSPRPSRAVFTARLLAALREDTDTRNKLVWWSLTGTWPEREP